MRKEYGKALRSRFDEAMRLNFPEYQIVKNAGEYLQPGEQAYGREYSAEVHCFIILIPDRSGADQFTIEIGWSRLGHFPHLRIRPSPGGWGTKEAFSQDEYVCRLPGLSKRKDFWWHIGRQVALLHTATTPEQLVDEITRKISPEEAKDDVTKPVSDAINELKEYGVPYLNGFLQSCSIIT